MTDGALGECPVWYRLVKAGKYLGVPPWEMAKVPLFWVLAAEEAQSAEAQAQAQLDKRHPPGG